MTKASDTKHTDTASEPLWMRCGPRGDQLVRWEDLTLAEQLDAIEHHNKLYPQVATS
jgi:hypothetical protein